MKTSTDQFHAKKIVTGVIDEKNQTLATAAVQWQGLDWNGARERRVILTLPHPADEPGTEHGMDSRLARKIGEMLIKAADNADKLQVFEFES